MAPSKRKGETPRAADEIHLRKKARVVVENRHKNSEASQPAAAKPTGGKRRRGPDGFGPTNTPAAASLFRDEEIAFPRGGSGSLTRVEKKQIEAQANRDLLFEQNEGAHVAHDFDSDEDKAGHGRNDSVAANRHKEAKKTKKSKMKHGAGLPDKEIAGVKIESLNFKRVVPGSLLLGQVSTIKSHEVAVALPNNLTGYIPLTSISDKLTERIERSLEEEDAGSIVEDASMGEADIDLGAYFSVGRYLRVFVTSINDGNNGLAATGRKRIELSVNPGQANDGLAKADLVVNSTVQASVSSIEDHGFVMDIGIQGTRGFIPSTAVGMGEGVNIKEGMVFLCMVTGHGSNGRIVKLSTDLGIIDQTQKRNLVSSAPTINSFLPGTVAEIQLSEISTSGLAGKIMGMLDATADMVHSTARAGQGSLSAIYQTGQKLKARIISTFPGADTKKVGFSILEHIMSFTTPPFVKSELHCASNIPTVSTIISKAKVVRVEPKVGLFVDIGVESALGFVHISKVSDGKVEPLSSSSGPYKVGSEHEARVIGHNGMDGLLFLTMEQKVIDQPFLRVEDVTVGQVVKGVVEKLMIGPDGVDGILVRVAEGISGLVPRLHIADVHLQHPEKKFGEGMAVKARVLSADPRKGRLRFTLKKSLVNSEMDIWKDYADIVPGKQSQGTLIKVSPNGAIVQFYGPVKGFLAAAEMSEAYINDATEHFRVGQVVSVHALNVNVDGGRLKVSCKDPSSFGVYHAAEFERLQPGMLVSGSVFEKSKDDLLLRLESGLVGRLGVGHLGDKSLQRSSSKLKDIRVGQKLSELLILDIQTGRRLIILTAKPSLVQAARDGKLPKSLEDVKEGVNVAGFVKNLTENGIFVEFAGGLVGLVPKSQISEDIVRLQDYGLRRFQSLSAKVHLIDTSHQRFYLTMKDAKDPEELRKRKSREEEKSDETVIEAVDGAITSIQEFTFGKLTKARVTSVKQAQVNVLLAKNVQGRIHVSEIFDKWEDIKDKKQPLAELQVGQILAVRILGIHDARNHRFLPLTYKTGKNPVFELSSRPSMIDSFEPKLLDLDEVKIESHWMAFVNNAEMDRLYVNISPRIRGVIRAFEVSDDLSVLSSLERHYPVGSVLKVKVITVKPDSNYLELSAKEDGSAAELKLDELARGMILPGKVTKVTGKQILVQLSSSIVGAIHLIDMADDYSQANPAAYEKNEVIRVSIVKVDVPNKRVMLSTRPSKVLSSSLEVKDREITSVERLHVNEIVRGFIQHVADNGLFVTLGHNIIAYVRVTNLSDSYLKEWKDIFQVDQLVQGKIISIEPNINRIQMSLKASVMDPNYVAPITFNDLKVGHVITGKIRKVEDFGAFIVIDGSANVSGLCHRTEMADQNVEDARKLYEEGDMVKAKILNLNAAQRRISFGLKASYFGVHEDGEANEEGPIADDADDLDLAEEDEDEDLGDSDRDLNGQVEEDDSEDEVQDHSSEEGMKFGGPDASDDNISDDEDGSYNRKLISLAGRAGLASVGFDWSGKSGITAGKELDPVSEDEENSASTKKKKKKAEIQIDMTGDLDAHGPQSVADFERLLLGEPDSSYLWLSYMAFQLELSEVDKARDIAERALRTIGIGQESEKMNVWVALLNLENTYGSDETLTEVFKRACQYNDAQEIHERLGSIYIQSGQTEKADSVFRDLVLKFSQDPKVWMNYAHFLFSSGSAPGEARKLLQRAMQSLPHHTHIDLTSKFAQFEFNSKHGDPEQGRTRFEALVTTFPNRVDLRNVYIDAEIKTGDKDNVRSLFERFTMPGEVKSKKAKVFFKKWLVFEEKYGDQKSVENVKRKAEKFVQWQKEQDV